MFEPKIIVILLNYNGWENTIECLGSLYQNKYRNFGVIVVDNASEDGSVQKIKDYYTQTKIRTNSFEDSCSKTPLRVYEYNQQETDSLTQRPDSNFSDKYLNGIIIIKNKKNYGFAEGNNIGIRYALKLSPDYILLLNNDTIVEPNLLFELVKYAQSDSAAGIVCPKTYCYYEADRIQYTWAKINLSTGKISLGNHFEIDNGQTDEIKETDYAPGSCLLIARKTIEEVGLFNSAYFCYWEEVDYCIRARQYGYKCMYYPNAKIWHKISQTSNQHIASKEFYMTRNMFWLLKQHSTTQQYTAFLLYFFGYLFWRKITTNLVVRKNRASFFCFLKGIVSGLKSPRLKGELQ